MQRTIASAVTTLIFLTPGLAQEPRHSPYAGLEQRSIKALSSEQIADLRAGKGMSLALAAELNGYPGPLHVLELAGNLKLADRQRADVEALLARMKAETIVIGERLITQEADLDRLFAGRTVTADTLASSVRAIGETQAALRHAHLKYHLATLDVLSPDQIRRYSELRGYSGHGGGHLRAH